MYNLNLDSIFRVPFSVNSVDIIGVLLFSTTLLDSVPFLSVLNISVASIILAVTYLSFISFPIHFSSKLTIQNKTYIFILYLFVVGLFSVFLGQVAVDDFFRGILPFLFLGFISFINLSDPLLPARSLRWLILSVYLWFLKLFVSLLFLNLNPIQLLTSNIRFTQLLPDSVIPFSIIIIPFLLILLFRSKLFWVSFTLLLLILVHVLLGGYRSQSAIVIVQIVIMLSIIRPSLKTIFPFLACFSIIGVFANASLNLTDRVVQIISRFGMTNASFESSRLAEWNFVFSKLNISPMLGFGPGFQVPSSVTFYGFDLANLGIGIVPPDSSGYVHSSIAYFLLTGGFIGLILYLLLFTDSIKLLFCLSAHNYRYQDSYVLLSSACVVSIFSLLLYLQVQASFRFFHVNLLLVLLLSFSAHLLKSRSRYLR